MEKSGSILPSAYIILVTFIVLTCVELSQSCHRRVEYHHFYKKPPPKGHGHGNSYGHGGGGGHQGYGKGHSQYGRPHGHTGGGHQQGYTKGHNQYGGHQSHGGGGHHQGYGKGYSQHGQPHGHSGGGHGHQAYAYGMGHSQYGEPHSHSGGHQGYGMGHSLYGSPHGSGHQEYGHGHEHGAYGEGPSGHEGYHEGDGYGHGQSHDQGHQTYGYEPSHGGGHGQAYGQGKGHSDSGQKGRKYKYQMYESTHYNDKGGHQPISHGYSQSSPPYRQKGYGYSGPYPNTEYSNPVEASVNAPTGPSSYSDVGAYHRTPTQLDAADTAELIRTGYDPKENELVNPINQPLGNFGGSMSDSSHSNSDYNSVDLLPTKRSTLNIPSSVNSLSDPLTEAKVSPAVGNFDLNLNFNSDLPDPFRSNVFESPVGLNSGRRKKLSSRYKGSLNSYGSASPALSHDEDSDASQSQRVPSGSGGPGPDYLENDTGDVGSGNVASNEAGPVDFAKMNF